MPSVATKALERVRREAVKQGYQREQLAPATQGSLNHSGKAKQRHREPDLIGHVFDTFYANKTFIKKLNLPKIVEAWEQIVGPLIAQHTNPVALTDEVLYVNTDATVWAAQLSALNPIIVENINNTLGNKVVYRIQVSGPKAKVPNYGPRTVKGRQGYRDTFG